jgi:signal peptidase I
LAGLAGVFNLKPAWLGGATVREGLRCFAQSGLLALPVAFLIVRSFGVEGYRILSHSMEPTLYGSRDWVLVNKLIYWLRPPRRRDIVVFTAPPAAQSNGEALIKRVIGLPGETVRVRRGRVWIRGAEGRREVLDEPYLYEAPGYHLVCRTPENAYFVLGDNRNHSHDSHVWGSVPAELVRGKAWLIFWPPKRIRRLR